MISNSKLKEIIDACREKGHFINMRDISYVLLCHFLDDKQVAYKAIFGNDESYVPDYCDTYHNSSSMQFLAQYISLTIEEYGSGKSKGNGISFEENRDYMLKLKKETEDAMRNHEIDKKDALVILKDISVKLTDKFNISDNQSEQVVHVFKKYNSVCQYCGHEIYIPTKEDMMEKYKLVEKQ